MASSGQIQVKSALDYETKTSYSVEVTVAVHAVSITSLDPNAPGDYTVPVTINVTDVNEAPTFTADTATRSVAENSAAGTNIGAAVTATDVDAGASLTYSLEGTDGGKFDIGSSTGQITVKTGNIPNYEAKTSYSVTVKVSDGSLTDTVAVTINVTDVLEPPEAPTVTASANSTTPTSKIDASWTPPDMTGKPAIDGYDVRYKKSDASTWTMHVFSGVVTAARGSDGTTASVSWTEYDGSDFKNYQVVVCTAAQFSAAGPSCNGTVYKSGAINSSSTTTQAVTGLTAATGYGVILQIWRDDGKALKLHVSMAANSNGTTVRGTPTFSATGASIGSLTAGKSYDVQARARNNEGTGAWSATANAITQVAPGNPNTPGAVTRSVAENSAAGTNVGAAVTATSNTNNYTLTHSLSGTDAGKFSINSSSGQITVGTGTSLDYESGTTSYSVVVTVKAAAAGVNSQSLTLDPNAPGDYVVPVTVNVTDVNEPPTISAPTVTPNSTTPKTKLDVSWTAPTMTGKPAVTDYDVQYRVAHQSNWIDLTHNGTATTATISGLTENEHYEVRVKAKNDEGDSGWSNPGHATTNADSATLRIAENSAANAVVGVVTKSVTTGYTKTHTLSGTDAGSFSIDSTNGQITLANGTVLDYEAKDHYDVAVAIAAAKQGSATLNYNIAVIIQVTDVAEPPATPAITVSSNTAAPTTKINVSWTTPDMTGKPALSGYDLQYRLSGASNWTDANFSGTSKTLTGLTAGKSYEVQVRAKNDEGDSPWASGSAITDPNAVTRSIAENSAAGTNVGAAVTATSNPNNYTLVHTMTGTDAGKFEISSATGQITVKGGNIPNYEVKTSYSVTVTVKAAAAGINSASLEPNVPGDYVVPVTINVTDVAEPPAKPDAPTVTATNNPTNTTLNVSWTAPDMTGKPALTDYDVQYRKRGETSWTSHTFTGTGTSTTITGQVGGVNYDVQVLARNDEGASPWSDSGDLDNTDPKLPDNPTRSIAENSGPETNVGNPVAATDPEGDTLTYTLTGTDAAKFTIESASGQIKLKTGTTLDYESGPTSYSVTVSVSDNLDSELNADTRVDDTAAVTINVTDVNEPPGKPGTPTQKTATTTTVTATWNAPDMTGKPPITSYWVRWWPEGKANDYATTNVTTNEIVIDSYPGDPNNKTPLTPGTTYQVKVLGKNDEGYDEKYWSDVGTLLTTTQYNNPSPNPVQPNPVPDPTPTPTPPRRRRRLRPRLHPRRRRHLPPLR